MRVSVKASLGIGNSKLLEQREWALQFYSNYTPE